MRRALTIFTDGACQGNPGPASIAFVIKENGQDLVVFAQSIGAATNNVAEYTAVIYALQEALMLRADEVTLHTDSELLARQLTGVYKVKEEHIKGLFDQLQHLLKGFKRFEIRHIPREQNNQADTLAKNIIRQEQTKVVASTPKIVGEESPSSTG